MFKFRILSHVLSFSPSSVMVRPESLARGAGLKEEAWFPGLSSTLASTGVRVHRPNLCVSSLLSASALEAHGHLIWGSRHLVSAFLVFPAGVRGRPWPTRSPFALLLALASAAGSSRPPAQTRHVPMSAMLLLPRWEGRCSGGSSSPRLPAAAVTVISFIQVCLGISLPPAPPPPPSLSLALSRALVPAGLWRSELLLLGGSALTSCPPWRVVHIPGGTIGGEPACECKRRKRWGLGSWVREIPWRRAWQPTPGFLPGESHGQKRLAGYSLWGHKQSDTTEAMIHTQTVILQLSTWVEPSRLILLRVFKLFSILSTSEVSWSKFCTRLSRLL